MDHKESREDFSGDSQQISKSTFYMGFAVVATCNPVQMWVNIKRNSQVEFDFINVISGKKFNTKNNDFNKDLPRMEKNK